MTEKLKKKIKLKPFLRWAGGKRWLTKSIKDYLPEEFNNYHEPFLGGASIFLFLKSNNLINKESFISDFNIELINTYTQIKLNPDEVIKGVKKIKEYKR